eukprot:SAG11_NODE_1298_length_5265_cov_3.096787_10_plen_111_part_00
MAFRVLMLTTAAALAAISTAQPPPPPPTAGCAEALAALCSFRSAVQLTNRQIQPDQVPGLHHYEQCEPHGGWVHGCGGDPLLRTAADTADTGPTDAATRVVLRRLGLLRR